MIIVTGAAGFIGTHLVKNLKGLKKEVIAVDTRLDDLKEGMSPKALLRNLNQDVFRYRGGVEAVIHQGANSDTTCYDTKKIMRTNFNYSVDLLNACLDREIPFIYASSAAVYGNGPFNEDSAKEPKNIYGKTKFLFDKYVECFLQGGPPSQIVGLRYFNVYGPHETHKNKMASVTHQFFQQIKESGKIQIFKNSENYKRDFLSVEDAVKVNLHFLANPSISGIFNCGTGTAESFYDIVRILKTRYDFDIEEVEMPLGLEEKYQKYTCSDNEHLQNTGGYKNNFLSLEDGVLSYLDFLEKNST